MQVSAHTKHADNSINRYFGFQRGIVLKHLSHGRCKVWIAGVYPDEWNSYDMADNLPDCEQASSLSFGANNGLGVFTYPNIGSIVWCFFENGDQNLPVYFASSLGGEEAAKNWDVARHMAGNHPEDAYVHKIHVKNCDIEIYETGTMVVKTHDTSNTNYCQLTMDSDGNATLDTSTTITLKTKSIILDASTQIDAKAPNVQTIAGIQSKTTSPAIVLDSSKGHTKVLSYGLKGKIYTDIF